MTKHLVLPDCQIRPGDDTTFLTCIGQYILEKRPEVVVCLGDFADMPSLSSYDNGKKSFEGRRYSKDVVSVHTAMDALLSPIKTYNIGQRRKQKAQYKPCLLYTSDAADE